MGFFDTYEVKSTAGVSFVKKEEKKLLIDEKVPLTVTRVFKGVPYDPKTAPFTYIMVFDLDGEERAISFNAGSVTTRDDLLQNLMEYLEQEDAVPPTLVLKMEGKSQVLDNYDAVSA
jgi:hypothetical protein